MVLLVAYASLLPEADSEQLLFTTEPFKNGSLGLEEQDSAPGDLTQP